MCAGTSSLNHHPDEVRIFFANKEKSHMRFNRSSGRDWIPVGSWADSNLGHHAVYVQIREEEKNTSSVGKKKRKDLFFPRVISEDISEEIEERKNAYIFTQRSSSKFLRMLKPDCQCDDPTPAEQVKIEQVCEGKCITSNKRPFQNKMPTGLDKPLQAEPRLKANIPKPEPRGSAQSSEEYESGLDGLAMLDKQYNSKGCGFLASMSGKHMKVHWILGEVSKGKTCSTSTSPLWFWKHIAICSLRNLRQRKSSTRRLLSTSVEIIYGRWQVMRRTSRDHERPRKSLILKRKTGTDQVRLGGKDEPGYGDFRDVLPSCRYYQVTRLPKMKI